MSEEGKSLRVVIGEAAIETEATLVDRGEAATVGLKAEAAVVNGAVCVRLTGGAILIGEL